MELTELQRQELDQTLWRDLEAFVRIEACVGAAARPAAATRCRSARERSTLGGLDLGDGLTLSGKIDRIDVETFGARGIVQDYKSGRSRTRRSRSRRSSACRSRSTCSCCATSSGSSRSAASTGRSPGERKPRGLLRASATRRAAGLRAERLPRGRRVLAPARDRARRRARARAADPRGRRAARPARTARARRGAISGRCAG